MKAKIGDTVVFMTKGMNKTGRVVGRLPALADPFEHKLADPDKYRLSGLTDVLFDKPSYLIETPAAPNRYKPGLYAAQTGSILEVEK